LLGKMELVTLMGEDYEDSKKFEAKIIDGKLIYKGEDWILLRAESLKSMLQGLWEVFGSGAITIMIISGEKMGFELAKRFKVRIVGEEHESAELLASFLTDSGWGKFIIKDYSSAERRVIIEVYDPSLYRGEPVQVKFCSFLRGIFIGFFSALWGVKASCKEVRCMADGYDYCSFQIKGGR
jgi:predicted hydrocarbon binding protein